MQSRTLIGAAGVCATVMAAAGCATSALLQQELTKTNTQTVLAFEETVYNKHEVQEAFRHYIGAGFVEHDPRLAGTPEPGAGGALDPGGQGAERAYRALIAQQGPAAHRTVDRAIAQGELVATQSQWRTGAQPGGALAVVDIYRLRQGRIVEHWDVLGSATAAGAGTSR